MINYSSIKIDIIISEKASMGLKIYPLFTYEKLKIKTSD